MKRTTLFLLFWAILSSQTASAWGFFAHKEINKMAIFTLPPEMLLFYKQNLDFIEQNAVNPDKRRTILKEEACRHYIDLDAYPDTLKLPLYWKEATERISKDTLHRHGIVPWHIQHVHYQLTEAFREMATDKILRLSADLGHYAADANVPLHTTTNYNGQLTNQHGIHGFWESRLPELFHTEYDFFIGSANYLESPQQASWDCVYNAHKAVDSVLIFERELHQQFQEDKKYAFEERNNITTKVYSYDYSYVYHKQLHGQVERQMRTAILFVGSLWYTAWVNAGQPDLTKLLNPSKAKKEIIEKDKLITPIEHNSCVH